MSGPMLLSDKYFLELLEGVQMKLAVRQPLDGIVASFSRGLLQLVFCVACHVYSWQLIVNKLDGVGPVDNRPSTD